MRNEDFYGLHLSERKLINRAKYSGKGRPKKNDYMTLVEAQKALNKLFNLYLDARDKKFS